LDAGGIRRALAAYAYGGIPENWKSSCERGRYGYQYHGVLD